MVTCNYCKGTGTCPTCGGFDKSPLCYYCHGHGSAYVSHGLDRPGGNERCPKCEGSGKAWCSLQKQMEVSVL